MYNIKKFKIKNAKNMIKSIKNAHNMTFLIKYFKILNFIKFDLNYNNVRFEQNIQVKLKTIYKISLYLILL